MNIDPESIALELLSPAKNRDIGIAAINCGADAVYIAGPSFGARENASNDMESIEELVKYAHKYSVKVYLTLNTILYDHEIERASEIIRSAEKAGIDALIIQDLGILKAYSGKIPLHASTQTNIRTPEQARFLESLGFTRLVLARELSLKEIAEIRAATSCELEAFIHGALCVSYSGQCYLSEKLTGRSANRGCCTQPCRSTYNLTNEKGEILIKNAPLLSLKDLCYAERIKDLARVGICSFKIEGRLKGVSYVSNVTRYYRSLLDSFIKKNTQYHKSSWGDIRGGFTPDVNRTFNRGYTTLFIDGKREGSWSSGETTGSIGEYIGKINFTNPKEGYFTTDNPILNNGDGLMIVASNGEYFGVRVDMISQERIYAKWSSIIKKGSKIYRNFNRLFEKQIEKNQPERVIDVVVSIEQSESSFIITACSQDGRSVEHTLSDAEKAKNPETALKSLTEGLSKKSGEFSFSFKPTTCQQIPFIPASRINSIRNSIAENLRKTQTDKEHKLNPHTTPIHKTNKTPKPLINDYRNNISNTLAAEIYNEHGIPEPAPAYELTHPAEAELMRTKYCIRYELGLCNKYTPPPHPLTTLKPTTRNTTLHLTNGKTKLHLHFDCNKCEMTIN